MFAEQLEQLAEPVALRQHGVGQILAIEAGKERLAAGDVELSDNVFSDALGGGCCEGDAGHVGEASAEGLEVSVVGPEVVSPLGDAVGLVDRDEADGYGIEERHEAGHRQAFGRDIEDLDSPHERGRVDTADLRRWQAAVYERRGNAIRSEGVHLVLHERDERRDHERQPVEAQSGQLVAQRLAAARWHQHQAVVLAQHVTHNLFLQRQEGLIPKMGLQQVEDLWRQCYSAALAFTARERNTRWVRGNVF